MKNQFKKIYIAFIAVLFIAISFCTNQTEARRGCCSWHGGVCGCKCCDGTFLSSTCAPYYPSCSSSSTPKINYTNSTSAYATVTRVVDGDTIEVKLFTGNIEKVRLIGIDTPETVDPRKPVECFGREATAKMKKLVNGKIIKLVRKTEENRGKYGRLLRYVYVTGDGTFINAEMIKQGYAYAYTKYPFDNDLMEKFKQYEKEAKKNKLGLWADGVCGNPKREIPTFIPLTSNSNQKTEKKLKLPQLPLLPRVKSKIKSVCYYHFTPPISVKRVYKIENNPTVWELSYWLSSGKGTRRPFNDPKSFLKKYEWIDIKIISQEELEKYQKFYKSY